MSWHWKAQPDVALVSLWLRLRASDLPQHLVERLFGFIAFEFARGLLECLKLGGLFAQSFLVFGTANSDPLCEVFMDESSQPQSSGA